MRCLIVDDVEIIRDMMALYLAGFGEIDTATDGVEAVELFAKAVEEDNPYHLVCLDIQMPNMGGQQALKQMRRLEKDAAVSDRKSIIVMTTASSDAGEMQEALWEGEGNDYLVKPVNSDDLLAILKKYDLVNP